MPDQIRTRWPERARRQVRPATRAVGCCILAPGGAATPGWLHKSSRGSPAAACSRRRKIADWPAHEDIYDVTTPARLGG